MQQVFAPAVKDLGHGVSCEKLLDGQIVVFTLTSMSRSAIDAWADEQVRILEAWPVERPICILGDQSSMSHLTFSPYMKSRFADFGKFSKGRRGRIALVIGKNFFAQMVTLLARSFPMGKIEIRCFAQREQGLAWLREIVEGNPG